MYFSDLWIGFLGEQIIRQSVRLLKWQRYDALDVKLNSSLHSFINTSNTLYLKNCTYTLKKSVEPCYQLYLSYTNKFNTNYLTLMI